MADDKWIAGLTGDMPAREAARLALKVRLEAVRDSLPAAVFHAEDDIEHVHQLRVATRRAAAALRIFAVCLPERLHKKTRQALRGMRRSAGQARDWDVFLDMLQGRLTKAPAAQRRGLDFLLGFGHGQRVLAQDQLRAAYEKNGEKFKLRIHQVDQALESARAEQTFRELAEPTLAELLHELESAAGGDLACYESLHRVRILGKQLRYAMEIFASCFAGELRDRHYPAIVEMQDILGLANDSFTVCQRLTALKARLMRAQPRHWSHYQNGIETLLAFHEKRLPRQRRKFETWWRQWLQSGAESAFADLLEHRPTP